MQEAEVAPAGVGQTCPAVPQLLGSLVVLIQPVEVLVVPAGQVKPQVEATHVAAVAPAGTGHFLPAEPQLFTSLVVETQVEPDSE